MKQGNSWPTRLTTAMTVATALSLLSAFALIALTGERADAVSSIRLGEALALGVPWLAFSIVGAIVVWHRPANTIGWLCSVGGLQVSLVALAVGTAEYGLAMEPPWLVGTASAWMAHIGSIGIVVVPLLVLFRFPSGRPLGTTWLRAERLAVGYVAALTLLVAVDPMPLLTFPSTPNPLAVGGTSRFGPLSFAPVAACAVVAIASLAMRFRRGSMLERRQIRLLAIASVLVGLAFATMPLTSPDLTSGGELSTLTAMINATAFTAIPVAIGIAITRDRLYDIDRVVNRTLVYTVVSAVLVGVYATTVVGLTALLDAVTRGATTALPTAASTLLVAVLFRPVRARAQGSIDRRFDRERYEASRTVEAFVGQIRDEVELGAIVSDLQRVAEQTVRPATTACWIRMPAEGEEG